jgi:hypothetical protein
MVTPDLVTSTAQECGAVALPVNPHVANRYHFGMLLGVADLDTEQGYHRGKAWQHQAWLHGAGTVWGLRVALRPEDDEVVVAPGLAIDGHGRELPVADLMCVNIARWFDERRPDDLEVVDLPDGGVTFTVHVVLCHEPCLDRPVPSIADPCDGALRETAYSRSVERGVPRIIAGPVPQPPPPDHPRLRQLLGQLPADDPLVQTAHTEIDAADPADRPGLCLRWFRRLAAEDAMDAAPQDGAPPWSPVAGNGCVPLAELGVHLSAERHVVADEGGDEGDDEGSTVDNSVRPTHLPTRTLAELLVTPLHTPAP